MTLFEWKPPQFAGATYDPERDGKRLSRQMAAVLALMQDGEWRTLQAIAIVVGGSEAGCSARLRDCRKKRFGSRTVERRHIANGLFQYRLVPQ